ncbi:transcription regulator [Gracilibacillus boraciitolerans JCM 21714]|uniref:Transcription regulator n=1 Tax=Gracilibacillus boraciitolerans JCM 21714 TaxID=1298598 RepID=W4VN51_9BACI|nr:transcription regulator [Gracilibacillus boraciitolerans JCM 21714]
MKAGGTINGIKNLLQEFDANVKAIGVLAEAEDEEEDRVVEDYMSLVQIKNVDSTKRHIEVIKGNYFEYKNRE